MSQTTESHEQPLTQLLLSLFKDQTECRMFLRYCPEGEELVGSLPHSVNDRLFFSEAVIALRKRGIINSTFFDRLLRERPRRAQEILPVRSLWVPSALEPGAIWCSGRYRLEERRESGGIGSVWKAVDLQQSRIVALKILHHDSFPKDRTQLVRERFIRGALTQAELRHPNIVTILEPQLREGDYTCYAMEYISGLTLQQMAGEPAYPTELLLFFVVEIGGALKFVHEHGRVHRDVKPSNVLVTSDGHAKLTDFDLVTGSDFADITQGILEVSPAYAAPEVTRGDVATHHGSSCMDVYGLAMTAVHCITRKPPPRLHDLHQLNDFLDELRCNARTRRALHNALHPDPELRTPTVEELCRALSHDKNSVAPDLSPRPAKISPEATKPKPLRSKPRRYVRPLPTPAIAPATSPNHVVSADNQPTPYQPPLWRRLLARSAYYVKSSSARVLSLPDAILAALATTIVAIFIVVILGRESSNESSPHSTTVAFDATEADEDHWVQSDSTSICEPQLPPRAMHTNPFDRTCNLELTCSDGDDPIEEALRAQRATSKSFVRKPRTRHTKPSLPYCGDALSQKSLRTINGVKKFGPWCGDDQCDCRVGNCGCNRFEICNQQYGLCELRLIPAPNFSLMETLRAPDNIPPAFLPSTK